MQKNEKGPLSHQKIKCSFLDYSTSDDQWTQSLPPLSSQKNEMLVFGLCSTSDENLNPICHSSPAKKMKCSFLDYVQLLMIGRAIWAKNINQNVKKQKRPPKSSKNKMFIFGLCSTSDVRPSDLSKKLSTEMQKDKKGPLSHQKIKCSFLDYAQLLMIGQLVNGLICHPSPAKKNEMLIFGLPSTSDDLARLVDGNPVWPPLSSQKDEMLIFGKNDVPGWWKSKPCPPCLSTKKMKCSFLDYVQLLMTGRAGWWTRTHVPPCLSSQKMKIFGLRSTSDDWPGKKWTATPLQPKNEMLVFGLCSTSDDLPGWSMDLNPICHPSPAKKMKCSFLDYIQLLMIGRAIWAKNVDQNIKKTKKVC